MNKLDYSLRENRVISRIFQQQAQTIPDAPFLMLDDTRISYQDAWLQSVAYAQGMRDAGVGKGDRVCLFMHSCSDYVLLSLAANLVGAQWIPVNTDYRGEWLQDTLNDSKPTLLFTDTGLSQRIKNAPCPMIIKGGAANQSLADFAADVTDSFQPESADYGEVAAVMWTSGTTGKSKGVMQSHNTWVRAALSMADMSHISEGDVIYNCLPLYNSAAWVTGIYPALLCGIPCALDTAFSPTTFWDRTRHYGASHVFTLGAMHMFLWNAPEHENDANNPVRCANMIPMPEDIMQPFQKRFGIAAIHQGFGQSEIMLLLRRSDDGHRAWPANALGEAPDDIDVALLDDDGAPVAVGDPGELCVKPLAPHVLFKGYFNAPEATRAAFTGDWYRTGDLARADENGNYFFVDRKKDLIRYKGRSVSSVAIEAIARRHPKVSDAAAFGVESAELSSEHEIMLTVVGDADPADLARFINENAPYFFVPRYIDVVTELPMTPTQKVRKVELRERGLSGSTWDAKAVGFEVQR